MVNKYMDKYSIICIFYDMLFFNLENNMKYRV